MALKLGELSTVLGFDDDQFRDGIDKSETEFRRFGDRLTGAAAASGAAAALALGVALAGALELDAAQAKLTAQLGSAEYAEELGKVAGNLYARGFGESATAAMESVRAVMQSGLLPEDTDAAVIEEITRRAQALADTFGVDVVQATRAAGQLIRTGLAQDATEALDIITRGFQKTGDFAGDTLDTVTEYSVQFQKIGIDAAVAFGLMSQGLQAGARDTDKIADAVKEFSLKAVDGSAGVAAAFQSLGLDAVDVSAGIAAGGPRAAAAFDQVLDKLRELGPESATVQQAIQTLFGGPGEDLGGALFALDLDKAAASMGKVDGAASKMADTLEQSASQQLEAFQRQAQAALTEELAKAIPTLQAVGGFLREHADIVGPLAVALGVLTVAVGAIVVAMQVWTAVQTAWGIATAISLGPVTLVILAIMAIVAGIYLLWDNWSVVSDAWSVGWDWISQKAQGFWDWLSANWPLLLGLLTGPIGWAVLAIAHYWDDISAGAKAAKDWVLEHWRALLAWFVALPGRIGAAAHGMWDSVAAGFRLMVNRLISLWNGLSFTIGGGSFAGMSIPSATFGTPDIPYLATGGELARAGMAMVGERGREAVFLPEGASVRPNRYGGPGGHAEAAVRELLLRGEFRISGSDLLLVLRDRIGVEGGDVQAVIGTNT